ncbi:21286_t:CDS:2 [Rhizophagus irregularis]|nr:21286_t:CDS:2 [Rhizophagus irregularis]
MNKREQTQRFKIDVNKNNDIAKYYEIPKIKILFHNEEFLYIAMMLGLMVIRRKDIQSAGIASVAFAKRKVDKYYLAIVRGWMKNDSYVVEQPIADVPNNRYRMCIGTEDNPGKSSKTEIKVLRRGYFNSSLPPSSSTTPPLSPSEYIQVTLIRLHPITGRRHQLRLHCQFLNHPIVGDWHYERQIMDYTDTWRMMLHAQKLVIPLNKNEEVLDVDAGDPFSELVTENSGYDYVDEVQRENK